MVRWFRVCGHSFCGYRLASVASYAHGSLLTGLILTDAQYGPSERDDATKDLDIDVTIPLQALVNTSQLYIPGRRSKVGTFLSSFFILSLLFSPFRTVVYLRYYLCGPRISSRSCCLAFRIDTDLDGRCFSPRDVVQLQWRCTEEPFGT